LHALSRELRRIQPLPPAQADQQQVAYPPAFPYASVVSIGATATKPPTRMGTGREGVDLCGYGPINEAQMPAGLEQAADSAILRAVEDLEGSREERRNALGLSMRAMMAALRASARASGWDAQNCFETDACDARTMEAQHRAAAPAAEALARLATGSMDPRTYASAMRGCRFIDVRASADCAALKSEQWAQLDPDNGFPWLEVAAAARKRRDFAANDEALRRASRSKVIDWRVTPYDEFLANVDARSEPIQTLVLSLVSTAYFGEERLVQYAGLGHYCLPEKGDAGRRQVCSDLAQLLVQHDPGLAGFEWGQSIAARGSGAGPWMKPSAELEALRTLAAGTVPTAEPLSCNWAAQTAQWLQGASKYGERGYLTKLLKERAQTSAGPTGAPPQR
jgi:hypothetical protein